MKLLFLLIIIFLFLYPIIEGLWVEDYKLINNSHKTLLNIYGEPLKPCQNNNTDKKGSWDNEGYCSEDKNQCMCLGAWALYKARQDKGEIESTDNELLCESIPEMALNPRYVKNWNTWNGHELPKQIKNGVDSLYQQCFKKANNKQKKFLKN